MDAQFRVSRGGRDDTGIEAIGWVKRVRRVLGAGEVVVNSIDTDGVKGGFDLPMLESGLRGCERRSSPRAARGRAEDFTELFRKVPDGARALPRPSSTSVR